MRSKSTPLFAALILAFAYLSLFFSLRTPGAIQNFLFFAVLLVEMVMIGAGWWYYLQVRSAAAAAIWRKRMALIGVIANTTALQFRSVTACIRSLLASVPIFPRLIRTQWSLRASSFRCAEQLLEPWHRRDAVSQPLSAASPCLCWFSRSRLEYCEKR